MKIEKNYTDQPLVDAGSTNYCSWERLKPYLEQAAGLHEDEYLRGVIADEEGLKILIGLKK